MRRFLKNLKTWGLNPLVVVTDGSNLLCHRALQNQPLMGAFRTSHPLRAVSLINFTSLDGSRFGS
jgi:hypothetical protein